MPVQACIMMYLCLGRALLDVSVRCDFSTSSVSTV